MPGAISFTVCCAALVVASAAMAQQGPGGATGGGQRYRPARPLLDIRNDFAVESRRSARNLADQLDSRTPAQRAEAYLAASERHRTRALAMAQLARCGATFPRGAAQRIREALRFDLVTWREAFQVSSPEWEATREEWLVERQTLTAVQWAERRAAWFRERDAWIASGGDAAAAPSPSVEAAPPRSAAGACAARASAPLIRVLSADL